MKSLIAFAFLSCVMASPAFGQTCGVSIGIASYPASVLVGARGTVAFTIDGPSPITRVQVFLGPVLAGEVDGQELRDMAAMRFSVPNKAETFNLTVSTQDNKGCTTTTSAQRPVAIVAALAAAPTLTCPTSQTIASSTSNAMGLYTPQTSGGVSPVTVTCAPASGSTFTGGPTLVSCRATDAPGRTASCVFPVTVQIVSPSTTPLVLTCPAGVSVVAGGSTTFAMPVPSGGVSPYLTFCDHQPTEPFPMGLTTVECRAQDFNGTQGACTFPVTVTAAQ